MSTDTVTREQLEQAFDLMNTSSKGTFWDKYAYKDQMIAAIFPTKFEPVKGQVVFVRDSNKASWLLRRFDWMDGELYGIGPTSWKYCRPLTVDEIGNTK